MSTAPATLPSGAAVHRFVFLTLPNYSLIALSSAVEALRMANRVAKKEVYQWTLASMDGAPVAASNGLSMAVSYTHLTLPTKA